MRTIKEHPASIKAPTGLDDPVEVLIGVVQDAAPCMACHGAPGFRKSLSRRTSGPMLGRHFGQCLRGAINAGGGHGLIAHNAALVGHHVCTTQHLVLLVWGGRACRGSQNQDHSAEPSPWSLHAPMPNWRSHVFTPSALGYAGLKLSTKFGVRMPLALLRVRIPPSNDPDQANMLLPLLCVFGQRANFPRQAGESTSDVRFAFGVRVWF